MGLFAEECHHRHKHGRGVGLVEYFGHVEVSLGWLQLNHQSTFRTGPNLERSLAVGHHAESAAGTHPDRQRKELCRIKLDNHYGFRWIVYFAHPATITSGFNMMLLPRIIDQDNMLLMITLSMSSKPTFTTFTSNGSSVQTADYDTKNLSPKVKLRSGQTSY